MSTVGVHTVEGLAEAIEFSAIPCNPIPFAEGIAAGCRVHGSDFIKSRMGKRILYILMVQAYGQLARIDTVDEYRVLTEPESAENAA